MKHVLRENHSKRVTLQVFGLKKQKKSSNISKMYMLDIVVWIKMLAVLKRSPTYLTLLKNCYMENMCSYAEKIFMDQAVK